MRIIAYKIINLYQQNVNKQDNSYSFKHNYHQTNTPRHHQHLFLLAPRYARNWGLLVRWEAPPQKHMFFSDRFSPKVIFLVWKPKTTSLNSCFVVVGFFHRRNNLLIYSLFHRGSFCYICFNYSMLKWYYLVKLMNTPSYSPRKLTWNLTKSPPFKRNVLQT